MKGIYILIAGALSLMFSCQPTTPHNIYNENLFRGKELMRRGEFEEARIFFIKASEIERLPESLAYSAVASYKIGDLKSAEYYIREADRFANKGSVELRIDGYKALIFLMGDNKAEGFLALQEYLEFYKNLKPLMNFREVEAMIKKRRVDIPSLEILLDEQIDKYEDQVEQFQRTGTGFREGG